jgi:hypothetical protein
MREEVNVYQEEIREALQAMGRADVQPHHVEAWMRLEHRTLDALGGPAWWRAIKDAVACVDASGATESEQLAASFGLRPAKRPS